MSGLDDLNSALDDILNTVDYTFGTYDVDPELDGPPAPPPFTSNSELAAPEETYYSQE